MTKEDFTKTIQVPIWAVTLIVIVAIATLGFAYRGAVLQGQVIEQISSLRREAIADRIATKAAILNLRDIKADRREIDRIYDILERIDKKLDEQ